jgi:hypothetical protein
MFGGVSRPQRCGPRLDASLRLYGPLRRWKLVAGRDVAREVPESPPAFDLMWSWLDLQFFWKHAFRTCADPASTNATYLCTKMVAEPTRTWLWLTTGVDPSKGNEQILEQALAVMREEESVLRYMLSLRRSLPSVTSPPLDLSVQWLWRVSSWIAERIAAETRAAGVTQVRLSGAADQLLPPVRPSDAGASLGFPADGAAVLPLVDWRARATLELPDEAFIVLSADPTDPREIGAVARAHSGSPHPALLGENLLLLPSARSGAWPLSASALRAIQCPATDPVSFALLAGRRVAEFPNLAGWNAGECAERAVLEHSAWLEHEERRDPSRQRRLGRLLSAARAALFAESFASGEPELLLTAAATADRLCATADRPQPVADAFDEYRRSRTTGDDPSASSVSAIRDAVLALPEYQTRSAQGGRDGPPRTASISGLMGTAGLEPATSRV